MKKTGRKKQIFFQAFFPRKCGHKLFGKRSRKSQIFFPNTFWKSGRIFFFRMPRILFRRLKLYTGKLYLEQTCKSLRGGLPPWPSGIAAAELMLVDSRTKKFMHGNEKFIHENENFMIENENFKIENENFMHEHEIFMNENEVFAPKKSSLKIPCMKLCTAQLPMKIYGTRKSCQGRNFFFRACKYHFHAWKT